MFIFKKEKRVVSLVSQHIDKTAECIDVTCEAIKELLSGNSELDDEAANQVKRLENDADELLREIRELLYSGAYLPTIRGDIYRLMSAVDDLCNKAQDCFDLVYLQKPQVGEDYQSLMIATIDLTMGCFGEFRKALKAFFNPKGEREKLRIHARQVSELESLIDNNERVLTAQIFESSLPLSEKLQWRQLVDMIVCISDNIEDAADELELVSLKSIV